MFGETKPMHLNLMNAWKWVPGGTVVIELCEYKNLGVLTNMLACSPLM